MKTLAARKLHLTIAIVMAGGLFLIAPTNSWAQQKFKYFFKEPVGVSKYTQQHVLDVGDVPGHQIRVASLQSKFTDTAPEYDGVKVTEIALWLTSDYIDASGRFTSYGISHMANGDKIFTRAEGIGQTSIGPDGWRKTSYSTVTTIVGGTGKFATIRGTIKGGGTTDFKTGTTGNPSEGEYWFVK